MKRNLILLAIGTLICGTVSSKIKPHGLFNDNAVLQQGIEVPVWGKADKGEQVTVFFNGQQKTTIAENGSWMIKLSPMAYGGPYTMTIIGKDTLTFKNIMVGEVWLASGQSNMQRQLGLRKGQQPIYQWKDEVKNAENSNIRMITIPVKSVDKPQDDIAATWMVCDTSSVIEFSAVAYFFARELQEKIKVPVGIIHSSLGGTQAERWISHEAMMNNDTLHNMVAEADSKRKSTFYNLYNGMIAPLMPYAIKGAIWYQGESNRTNPEIYNTLFTSMMKDWRMRWGIGDFPFLFVQVAPYKDMPPEIRDAQLQAYYRNINTAMIVTTDVGDCNDIHPIFKQQVGYRLSLSARKLAYHEDLTYMGPVISGVKKSGNRIILSFDHATHGFLKKSGGIKGFELGQSNGKYVAVNAKIKGSRVILSAKKSGTPKISIRYGWSNCPDVNLFNREGLPASPFQITL